MEKRHTPLEVISGSNGTKIITGAITGSNARGFQVNEDATISVLTSEAWNPETNEFDDVEDVLTDHIQGGVATTLSAGTIVMCQQHHFVNITPATGSINLIL